jgi:hypothetical protein
VASSGGARGFANYRAAAVARVGGWLDLFQQLQLWGMETLRVSASIYNLTGGAATARWISIGS